MFVTSMTWHFKMHPSICSMMLKFEVRKFQIYSNCFFRNRVCLCNLRKNINHQTTNQSIMTDNRKEDDISLYSLLTQLLGPIATIAISLVARYLK